MKQSTRKRLPASPDEVARCWAVLLDAASIGIDEMEAELSHSEATVGAYPHLGDNDALKVAIADARTGYSYLRQVIDRLVETAERPNE